MSPGNGSLAVTSDVELSENTADRAKALGKLSPVKLEFTDIFLLSG
jgi:hypothetical protein